MGDFAGLTNLELKNKLAETPEQDIAELLIEAEDNALLLRIFKLLSKDIAAEVFSYLPSEQQEHIITAMSDKEVSQIVAEMFIDDAVDVLEEMPANIVKKILKNADEETRRMLNQFLNYPENSAGSIMTPEFVDLKEKMTVSSAFDRIRKIGTAKETIYTCYVTTADRMLLGVVTAKTLILSDREALVGDIMDGNIVYCNTHDDREHVALLFKKYGFNALPVVDMEHRLVGIITVDDILDVIEEEHTEDIQKMAAMLPTDKPYLETGVFSMVGRRVVWLLLLMVSAFFTGMIMKGFDSLLGACIILTFSMPMLMDTGGNCGSQTATMIIRGLSLGELAPKDYLKILWKEIRIAVIVGLCLAPIAFIKVFVLDSFKLITGGETMEAMRIALTVSLTMICVVIVSKVIASFLPILAKKIKIDPAVMASPVLSTLLDSMTLIIYFGIASALVL